MRSLTALAIVLAAAVVPAGAAAGAPEPPPTLEEIVERHLEAVGGEDAWREIGSLRLTGRISIGGTSSPVVVEYLRPQHVRIGFELQGLEAVRAWNGRKGWVRMPMLGREEAVPMEPEEARTVAKLADFDGPYVGREEDGLELELLGLEDVDGLPAWAIGIRYPDGFEMVSQIDARTWLEVRQAFRSAADGEELRVSTTFSDHRSAGNVIVARTQTTVVEGQPTPPQVLRIEVVEIDAEIPTSRFEADGDTGSE